MRSVRSCVTSCWAQFRIGICLAAGFFVLLTGADADASAKAKWTVMVYMNSKNDLENAGIQNFLEMASVPDTPNIRVVVEMGRPSSHIDNRYGAWSGIRLFTMRNGLTPESKNADLDLSTLGLDDMGSVQPVEKLLEWSLEHDPAEHYMLIIWNHGEGWRLQLSPTVNLIAASTQTPAAELPPPPASFRSISFDGDSKHFLYNRDLEETLRLWRPKIAIDVIGFDACLMSMIETSYAMRDVANVMVASEELEPGVGWPYKKWLSRAIMDKPSNSKVLSRIVVEAYRDRFGDIYKTTLTAIDLKAIPEFSRKFSAMTSEMIANLDAEKASIKSARDSMRNYGEDKGLYNSIDLGTFLVRYSASTRNSSIAGQAKTLVGLIDHSLVIENYASSRMIGDYGSTGLAFYFPVDRKRFIEDKPDNIGYDPSIHDNHAVEFVEREQWSKFLQAYLLSM
jgi:Clostripain family